MMKLAILSLILCIKLPGMSQLQLKRLDSIANSIDAKKTLTLKVVSDTFRIPNAGFVNIENVKFYSLKGKLQKAIFSTYYHQKDSSRTNILTGYEVFYFNNDLLIKVTSKDFDQTPPKDLQFYLNERDLKKYMAKQTTRANRYDGANYFVEIGYNLLDEFKALIKK